MRRSAVFIPLFMTVQFLLSCNADRFPCSDHASFIIDSIQGVGCLAPFCAEQDLISFYGLNQVKRAPIALGEGDSVDGTILFPGSRDSVCIEWKHFFKNPARITISGAGTRWHTQEGITVGTALERIEKINGCKFQLTGFGWDYQGRTLSWEKGKLPQQRHLCSMGLTCHKRHATDCGIRCNGQCELYKATQEGNNDLKRKIYDQWKWREKFKMEFDPEKVFCYGCKPENQRYKIGMEQCTVRQCATGNGMASCIQCRNLASCEKEFWKKWPGLFDQVKMLQKSYAAQPGAVLLDLKKGQQNE